MQPPWSSLLLFTIAAYANAFFCFFVGEGKFISQQAPPITATGQLFNYFLKHFHMFCFFYFVFCLIIFLYHEKSRLKLLAYAVIMTVIITNLMNVFRVYFTINSNEINGINKPESVTQTTGKFKQFYNNELIMTFSFGC